MKEKLIWMRNNVLLTFVFAVLVVSVIMLGFYFCKFNNGFSTDNDNWGAFGSYFASITGLLAFAGALYAIHNSNKQAKSIEERGVFFKILESYQKQVNSAEYNGQKGIEAFKEYGERVINYSSVYLTLDYYCKKYFNDYVEEGCLCDEECLLRDEIIKLYKSVESDKSLSVKNELIDNFYTNDIITKSREFYKYNSRIMKPKDHLSIMKQAADKLYNEEGHFLGSYFRNIYYLLMSIRDYQNSAFYFNFFRAQLSRYELVILLYNAISSQSNESVIELYVNKGNTIFNNIDADDVLGCTIKRRGQGPFFNSLLPKEKSKGVVKEFIINLFEEYRCELSNNPK